MNTNVTNETPECVYTPSSEIPFIIRHATVALSCYADTAMEQHSRGIERGLLGARGMKALSGAASRANELSLDLAGLISAGHTFTPDDNVWIEAACDKVWKSRSVILRTAESDFERSGYDLASPEYDQLSELECRNGMYEAVDTFASIADALRFTLSGRYDPTKARVIAAEAIAYLQTTLREAGL